MWWVWTKSWEWSGFLPGVEAEGEGAEGAVGEEEEDAKWEARSERRLRAVDMVARIWRFLVEGRAIVQVLDGLRGC